MGENVLLLSINRMYRASAVYIVATVVALTIFVFAGFASAEQAKNRKKQSGSNAVVKQDLLIGNSKHHDILTSPQNQQRATQKASSTKKTSANTASSASPNVVRQSSSTAKPDKNIDVYIGRCPYTVEGIKEVKKFIAQHKEYYGNYFMMKTDSDYDVKPSELSGLEIYLPLEADKYDITNVPALVINVDGQMYKISGTPDLEEIYKEIKNGKAKGERKSGYIDLGVRGKSCKAIIVNLTPKKTLTEQEKREVIRDAGRPPDFTALLHQRKITLPENNVNSPLIVEKQIGAVAPHGVPRYIVFSQAQKKWALEQSKKGAMGCCTDCIDIGDISHFAQLCTKEILDEFKVQSTPAIVNLKK